IDLMAMATTNLRLLAQAAAGQVPGAESSMLKLKGTQIRQAIANLVINALEASPAGREVVVATGVETLSAASLLAATLGNDRAPGTYAYVEVHDEGPGMDEATLSRIFDPFFSTRDLGRGLGLAAVQGIVRGHDGALRVNSAPGRGTTMRVWFPVAERPR
ncbi:MAG: ATP-binding protein, partial [Vicinamibacteria bacterium]